MTTRSAKAALLLARRRQTWLPRIPREQSHQNGTPYSDLSFFRLAQNHDATNASRSLYEPSLDFAIKLIAPLEQLTHMMRRLVRNCRYIGGTCLRMLVRDGQNIGEICPRTFRQPGGDATCTMGQAAKSISFHCRLAAH